MRRYSINELIHFVLYAGERRGGIRAIFWGNTIRQFSASAVGLFVPVYVYLLGTEAGGSFVGGLRTLILFLFLTRLSVLFSSLFVEHLVDRIGFRWTLLTSSAFLFCKFIFLTMAQGRMEFLWIAGLTSGLVTASFWISRHALFGEDQEFERVGTSLGSVVVLTELATAAGPILGGFIAAWFGFATLFHFGLLLALASSVPYFFMQHHRRHHPDGIRGLIAKFKDPANLPLVFSWFGRSWDNELHLNFWPLFVFLTLAGVEKVGELSSAVAVVSIISAMLAGRVFDRTKSKARLFLAGAGMTALLWPAKAFVRSFGSFFLVDSMQKSSYSFYWIPFLSQTYRFAFRRDTVAFFAFREVVWSVGVLVFLGFAFLLTYSWSWPVLFFLGALGVLNSVNLVSYQGFGRE